MACLVCWEALWPHVWCAGLQMEQSVFELCRRHCLVFIGKTLLLSLWVSPPRCINGYQGTYWG